MARKHLNIRLVGFTDKDKTRLEAQAVDLGLSSGRLATWLIRRCLNLSDPLDPTNTLELFPGHDDKELR